MPTITETLEPLELLDLKKRTTVGQIVEGMAKCSFGARMLGEVARDLRDLIHQGFRPGIIYDGRPQTSLTALLGEMVERGWFEYSLTPEEFRNRRVVMTTNLAVGNFSDQQIKTIGQKSQRTIFINSHGLALPGRIRDGHFPDAVFTDPDFAIPVISAALGEWLDKEQMTASELMPYLSGFGGAASLVSQGAEILLQMVQDPDCTVFLTVSGAMTIAKMGLVICDMIDLGMVDCLCTTGAMMAHGLTESIGYKHYKYDRRYSDLELAAAKLNRVTDTLEPEINLDHVEGAVSEILRSLPDGATLSPRLFFEMIGDYLIGRYPGERGILKSARKRDIAVLSQEFFSSELGNNFLIHNHQRREQGRSPLVMEQGVDADWLVEMTVRAKRLGVFIIGGGVPKNFILNLGPLIEIMNHRLKRNLPIRQFLYGCRICPDPMWLGHLSGCTINEGISWRKFDPQSQQAEILADATQVLPFIVRFVMDKLEQT